MLTSTRSILAAAALLASVTMVSAQTTQDQSAHHPGSPAPAMPMGDMGKMMGGDMGAMMQSMMPMMRMMMTRGEMGEMGMMSFDHIEGRIAFLKAELAITDAQLPQWNAFADTLRARAKSMQETMAKLMKDGMPTSAPARGQVMVQIMTARLDSLKAMVAASDALYAVLSDDQKKVADSLLNGRGPMMGMGMGL